jgi:hypothetical protein
MTAIILGAGGGVYLDRKIKTNRYPISVEYKIVHSCLSSYEKPLYARHYILKKQICVCALKETEDEIDFDEYKKDENRFLNIFENKAKECIRR